MLCWSYIYACFLLRRSSDRGGDYASGVRSAPVRYCEYGIDQDMDRVKAVMDTYDVDVQIYPMVRVSSISGNSSLQQDERSVNTEQGAYIGITEDTYRSLKEALGEKSKDLELKRRRDLHGLPAECFHAFPEPGLQRIQNGKLSPVRTASLLLQCRPQARAFPRT